MRVLQVNSVFGIGSTGRIAKDIHNLLTEQGHESYVAYGRGGVQAYSHAIRIGNKSHNYVHVALTRLLDKHGFGSVEATRNFVNNIRAINPDIIHLHNIHGYYINIEILFDYIKNANKPVIWTLHDCWSFTGHCAYFDFVGCNKWQTVCCECPAKKSYPRSLVKDNSRENFKRKKKAFSGVHNLTIVTPSKWLAGLVQQSFLGEYPVAVINNGVDLEKFKLTKSLFRDKHNIGNKDMILGVASTWDNRKGLKYFKELARHTQENEVIVLVGLSSKQVKMLPPNVIGITKTNNVIELAEIYSAANVFVNPTLEDNFPTTNLEALACGTPVITFDTGGSVESIDESCGRVVRQKDSEELLDEIRRICRMDASILTRNCLARAHKFYNKTEKFYDYISLYKQKIL